VKDSGGNDVWLWAVSQFEDDSYLDGKTCSPVESAETADKLLLQDEDNEDSF
jgi:hypothetical protein